MPTKFSIDSALQVLNGVKQREDTEMKNATRTFVSISLLLFAAISMAETSPEPRQSLTSQGGDITRGSVVDGNVSFDEFDALQTTGGRTAKDRRSAQQKIGAVSAQAADPNIWFYDADVELFSDLDRDGYYTGIDLLFDADTTYVAIDVYAVLYLSYEYGPWNEYASTDDFTLFGATSADDYIVETELVAGYPTGNYDILIELFDAYDGTFLASIGPDETSELALLPLEDSARDAVTTGHTHVVVTSGGGSLSWLLLLGLLAVRMTFRPQAARLSK
jgi:hypothetical protein